MTTEIVLMWAALSLYVVGTALFVFGVTFEHEKLVQGAVWASGLGLLPQLASIIVRWVRLGHGPYLGYFEVTSALAFFSVFLFVALALRRPQFSVAGIAIMPVALLLIAAAMLAPKSGLDVSPTLASWWLVIHVTFAKLSFATFVTSFGLAAAYIIRSRSADGPWARRLQRLPSQERVDHLSSRFVYAGFLFWGIMIASGAIWANEAWGRYWGWDPIETWSLVVWIIYAAYLHLRLTMGWRGEKISWVAVLSMPIAMFCLVGIPFVYVSIHSGYIS
ncbi:MAG: c-type cytochrome biogenesis protein CcsB [Coriobacteriia bacterium]|nr:c-type cytochrome biogenesis protein CcsB [Coriobacteriia bacterium]